MSLTLKVKLNIQTIGVDRKFHGIADQRPRSWWSWNSVAIIDEDTSPLGVECNKDQEEDGDRPHGR